MHSTDPIADYLTRIRNAIRSRHKRVDIPSSYLKMEITKILSERQFIRGYTEVQDNKQGIIRITLRYTEGTSAITGIRRVSRPGLRVYAASEDIERVMNGMGIAIVSTSKGVMTDVQARTQKIGGEVLCHVW